MQRDLQITPRRLEYTREKEGELYCSLMAIANRKQEEMKEMIVETLGSMKEQLLEDAANLEFTGSASRGGGGLMPGGGVRNLQSMAPDTWSYCVFGQAQNFGSCEFCGPMQFKLACKY